MGSNLLLLSYGLYLWDLLHEVQIYEVGIEKHSDALGEPFMKQQQMYKSKRWLWTILPVLAIMISNTSVFAQATCPAPRDPSDVVKIEVMAQEAFKSKGDFEDAGTITKKKYLEELRKLVILISIKQEAVKKVRAQLDLDEIALKALDQQIQ